MRPVKPGRIQSAINVTPLVDVVLVLLIIFMVMAPQMHKGPDVHLPDTAKPREQGDERGRILVSIDEAGGLWIDDQPVAPGSFGDSLRAAAGAGQPDIKAVSRGDAPLPLANCRRAKPAIQDAG